MFFNPTATGRISDTVCAVKVGMVNFFVYREDDYIICIDSGFKKSKIVSELNKIDIDPNNVTHLFLTHSDYDHAGGLDLFPRAKIYLSAEEEQMVTRKKARQLGVKFNANISRPYTLLKDTDTITIGSIRVRAITTPGHTPGSMSYLVNETVLFAGDALSLRNGVVYLFTRLFNMDTELQKKSIRKLAHLDNVQMVCTAHTGYSLEFDQAMAGWK